MVSAVTPINLTALMEYMSIKMKLSMLLIDIIIEFKNGYAVRFFVFDEIASWIIHI